MASRRTLLRRPHLNTGAIRALIGRMATPRGAAISIVAVAVVAVTMLVIASGGIGLNDDQVGGATVPTTTAPPPPPPPPLFVTPATVAEESPPTTTLPQWRVRIAGYDGPGSLLSLALPGESGKGPAVLAVPSDPWLVPPAGLFAVGDFQFRAIRRGEVAEAQWTTLSESKPTEPLAVIVQATGASRRWIEGRTVR